MSGQVQRQPGALATPGIRTGQRAWRSAAVTSDAANGALQAWEMLHGHLLLHGWTIGDATYYTFELPVIAIVEIFLGLHTLTMPVAMAVIYLIVAACAVAIAVTDSNAAPGGQILSAAEPDHRQSARHGLVLRT